MTFYIVETAKECLSLLCLIWGPFSRLQVVGTKWPERKADSLSVKNTGNFLGIVPSC